MTSGSQKATTLWKKALLPRFHPPCRMCSSRNVKLSAFSQAIVRVSSLPADFTSWNDSDLERDDFSHFRESSALDSLAACHKELGTAMLRHVSSMLHQGSTWQLKEAGLFVARAISPAVCTAAMGAGLNGVLGGGGEADEQGVSAAFVSSLFENLPKASEGK